jgi:hypothetical protein
VERNVKPLVPGELKRSVSRVTAFCRSAASGAIQLAVTWYLMMAPYVGPLKRSKNRSDRSTFSMAHSGADSNAECEVMRQAVFTRKCRQPPRKFCTVFQMTTVE